MSEIAVTEDEPFIRVTISAKADEPMRENRRQAEATRAAKKFVGGKVSCLSSGGSWSKEAWELHYTYVRAGYKFAPRTD